MLDELREYYRKYKPKTYLFEGQKGSKYSGESALKIIKRAAAKSGIKRRVSPHMLRHSPGLASGRIYTHVATTAFNSIHNLLDLPS